MKPTYRTILSQTEEIQSIFRPVYKLLCQSFPPNEKRDFAGQQRLLLHPCYSLFTAAENQKLLGIIAAWNFPSFRYIEHFAISPACRNLGLGSQMLGQFMSQSEKPVVLEVEPPDGALSVRRIGFYQRNGFALHSFPYRQPPLNKGDDFTPLLLMSTHSALSQEQFIRVRDTLYQEVYRYAPVD